MVLIAGCLKSELWETVETHFLYILEQKDRISQLEVKLENQIRENPELKARLETIEKLLNKK